MRPGDLLQIRPLVRSWAGNSISGVKCLVIEVLEEGQVLIVMAQGRTWAALAEQLEPVDD